MEKRKVIVWRFKNGVTADFIICKDKNNPIATVEWSCEPNKENLSSLVHEYVSECVPFVYQKIADYLKESVVRVDVATGQVQSFKPIETI